MKFCNMKNGKLTRLNIVISKCQNNKRHLEGQNFKDTFSNGNGFVLDIQQRHFRQILFSRRSLHLTVFSTYALCTNLHPVIWKYSLFPSLDFSVFPCNLKMTDNLFMTSEGICLGTERSVQT